MLTNETYNQQKITQTSKQPIIEILNELSRKGKIARRSLITLTTAYPTHEAFVTKTAQLDEKGLAKVLKRLNFLAQPKLYLFWKKPE